ncbi:MAG: guanylate kinase [Pseudomonadales bacterium]|nr:guanylate kinase [Pseudomonadales bacterium]
MSGSLFIVTAASGTGKTSLVSALMQDHPTLSVSVSHTTRPQRPGEVDGVNYHFVERSQFKTRIANQDFLEYAEVFGNYYGTSRQGVDRLLMADRDVLLEIDWQGAAQVRNIYPDAVSIFILPPSLLALRERLITRAQDADSVVEQRLQSAVADIRHHDAFDYIIINDDFQQALLDLRHITATARLRRKLQINRHAHLLKNLLD